MHWGEGWCVGAVCAGAKREEVAESYQTITLSGMYGESGQTSKVVADYHTFRQCHAMS